MTNMNVENECKDARDAYEVLRRAGKVRPLLPGHDGAVASTDIESLTTALERDAALDTEGWDETPAEDADDTELTAPENAAKPGTSHSKAELEVLRILATTTLWSNRGRPTVPYEDDTDTSLTSEADLVVIKAEAEALKILGRDKHPAAKQLEPDKPHKRRKLAQLEDVDPRTSIDKLSFIADTIYQRNQDLDELTAEQHLEQIIDDMEIRDNIEQTRAIRIIAEHFIFGMERQLLLYIAGVGGSGKSYIIKAVVEFFRRCGVSESMMLSAPTGCAAVLINGFTIHALTFLPKKKDEKTGAKTKDLAGIWIGIRYIVIDEISMVSADLLAQISARLNEGRAMATQGTDNMFGRINVILLGDMGQLRPVRAHSLFAHQLVHHISAQTRETCTGIDSMYGAWLWREFTQVVILRKNFRALGDPEYTNLLARIRMGIAWDGINTMKPEQKGDGQNYSTSDYRTVNGRQLQSMSIAEQATFVDAPIVCATKVVRDLLNRELSLNYGNTVHRPVHDYYAKDSFKSKPLNEELQKRTWYIRSTLTKDAIGRLPLCIGMRVMIMENIALKAAVVNGAEGILRKIKYSVDDKGRRYADCAYVEVTQVVDGKSTRKVVPIVPETSYFNYTSDTGLTFSISRSQLPLLPSYAYTDYKSQGRSLKKAILDLNGCMSLQSVYVMLSRATSLKSIAVLRSFNPRTLNSRLGEEFREEFARLEALDAETTLAWERDPVLESEEFATY
jgi:ATP-dependent DNA helicase PIF1